MPRQSYSALGVLAIAVLVVSLLWAGLQYGATSANLTQAPQAQPQIVIQDGAIKSCEFSNSGSDMSPAVSNLDSFSFSQPRVLPLGKTPVMVLDWIDGENKVLVARELGDRVGESIEILDLSTGTTQSLAEANTWSLSTNPRAQWVASEHAAVFAETGPDNKGFALRWAKSDGTPAETIANDLQSPYVALDSDGIKTVTSGGMANAQYSKRQSALWARFDLNGLLPDPNSNHIGGDWGSLQQAISPDGSQIVLTSPKGVFFLKPQEKSLCKFELDTADNPTRWVLGSRWSSDSRYVAFLDTASNPPLPYTHVSILDTQTGKLIEAQTQLPSMYPVSWAPDGRTFMVVGMQGQQELMAQGRPYQEEMYIGNAGTGEMRRILDDQPLVFTGMWGAVWSPDGKQIVYACPITEGQSPNVTEANICVVEVNSK